MTAQISGDHSSIAWAHDWPTSRSPSLRRHARSDRAIASELITARHSQQPRTSAHCPRAAQQRRRDVPGARRICHGFQTGLARSRGRGCLLPDRVELGGDHRRHRRRQARPDRRRQHDQGDALCFVQNRSPARSIDQVQGLGKELTAQLRMALPGWVCSTTVRKTNDRQRPACLQRTHKQGDPT